MGQDNSTDKDLTDNINDFLVYKKEEAKDDASNDLEVLDNRAIQNSNANEIFEEFTQHMNQLESTPKRKMDLNANTPPSSPAEFKIDAQSNSVFNQQPEGKQSVL